jgi:hypothetical protein
MFFNRWLTVALVVACSLGVGGCATSTKKDYPASVVRIMIEAPVAEAGAVVRLPKSGTVIAISPKSQFTEYDIVRCESVQNELGRALVFEFTPQASRDLYRLTASNQTRRLVTAMNGVAIGARRIDRPIAEGFFMTYVELEDENLEEIAKNITKTSQDAIKELEKKGL